MPSAERKYTPADEETQELDVVVKDLYLDRLQLFYLNKDQLQDTVSLTHRQAVLIKLFLDNPHRTASLQTILDNQIYTSRALINEKRIARLAIKKVNNLFKKQEIPFVIIEEKDEEFVLLPILL